ncbi:MAG: hypothetical protein ACLFVK_00155 [Dehalococcoidia bacterium]
MSFRVRRKQGVRAGSWQGGKRRLKPVATLLIMSSASKRRAGIYSPPLSVRV